MTISTLVDLVKVYTPTSGQGALTLGAAVPGFLTPSTVIPAMTSGSLVSYGISDPSGNEVGQGVLTLSGSAWTLTRGVTQSSNGGAPILCTGQAVVALTLRAEDIYQGQVLLASGSLNPGVASLQFALPGGFVAYKLYIRDLQCNLNQEGPYLAVSIDGGRSFQADFTNFDTYAMVYRALSWSNIAGPGGGTDQALYLRDDGNIDACAYLNPQVNFSASPNPWLAAQQGSMDHDCIIYPGDSATSFRTYTECMDKGLNPENISINTLKLVSSKFNAFATTPPILGRVNAIRIATYSFLQDPTVNSFFSKGTYSLWGLTA